MSPEPSDLSLVLELLSRSSETVLAGLFDPAAPIVLARAPGRLDVMGGFADYSGSLTLEMPIREAAFVAVQERAEPSVRIVSSGFGAGAGVPRSAEFPLAELSRHTRDYATARQYLNAQPEHAWTAYVAGVLAALQIEWGRAPRAGLRIWVASNVPEGKGVSSSAALEVATLRALAGLYGVRVDPVRAALACQRVENLVVGAACGVMDQMTSSCGVEGQLLPLLCQPAELEACFAVPRAVALWGIDSGLRHAVSGAGYTEVRVAAFMGYRWIAALRGYPFRRTDAGQVSVADPEYGGYLARVPRGLFEREYRVRLPERIGGAEFLSRFGGITDPITRVRPECTYRVRAATAHPIEEHARATEFRELMQDPVLAQAAGAERVTEVTLQRLGDLMFQAHESYSACGLGSSGTDRIVELVRELGPERGLYGAKITGGGSGGTVAVLGRATAASAVRDVVRRYAAETRHVPYLFSGSSPGAAAFGVRQARHTPQGWALATAGD